ncbi:MAG: hypothetical protein ACXVQJ_05675 [Actinomycetota bacterium]
MPATDDRSRTTLALALGGIALLPAVLVIVALLPQGWRGAAYLLGLACVAAVSLAGGMRGFRAIVGGSERPAAAVAAAIVGLTAGATFAVLALLGALSLLS